MLAKQPFLFRLYKSGGGYVNSTIGPVEQLALEFKSFYWLQIFLACQISHREY